MRAVWRKAATFSSAVVLAGAPAAAARADSIGLSATAGSNGPSSVVLSDGLTLAQRSFVGSVLSEGRLVACAPDYAAALAAPRSATVEGSFLEQAEGSVGIVVGATVVLPRGTWSLCGWVQPGGEAPGVPASAVAGPVAFTVGGPEGTTSLPPPAVFGQEQRVTVPVLYILAQAAAQLPGSAQASLQLAVASSGSACPGVGAGTDVALDGAGPLVQSATVSGPASGTVSFAGHLAPGTYSLCAWLIQTFPQTSYATLAGLLPQDFGSSTQSLTVLPRPAVSRLTATVRHPPHRRASLAAHYSLNEPSTVTIALKRIIPGRRSSAALLCVRDPIGGRRVCGLARTISSLRATAPSGADTTVLPIARGGLKPGVYVLEMHSEDAAHEVSPTTTIALNAAR